MTSNTSRFWSQSPITTNLTYSNNKKQGTGISYDLEGNLTQDTDLQYTYDAAGRSGSVFSAASNKTITPIYDGDGQVVHRTEVEGSNTIANLYQLRSTVMGGSVITELDSAGQKKKGFVYCNGKVIARQEPNVVVWEHENPFTGTRGISGRDGVGSAEVEPDALGVDMGLFDPFPVPEQWEPPADGLISLLPGSGNPSNRCTFDGIPILCFDAGNLLRMGVVDFEQPTVVWDDGWKFVHFNRDTGEYDRPVFSHYDYTSVTADGKTSGRWHPVYIGVSIGSRVEGLFRIFAFGQSRTRGKGKKTSATTPPKPVDFSVLFSALKTCIPELWEWFEMTGFTPTTAPGKDDSNDKYNGIITIHDKELGSTFQVINDPTPPADIKAKIIERPARGATDPYHPFWNYAYPQGDRRTRPGERRYPELFGAMSMDYIRVQIHETAVSLTGIRNIYHSGPWARTMPNDLDPTHDDDGPALEDCVGRKYYEQMGLTPVRK